MTGVGSPPPTSPLPGDREATWAAVPSQPASPLPRPGEEYLAAAAVPAQPAPQAPRHGEQYTQEDVDLLYLVRVSPDNDRLLADLLGRSPEAISFARRWADHTANFPPEARNRLRRQFANSEGRLGPERRGKHSLEEAVDLVRRTTEPVTREPEHFPSPLELLIDPGSASAQEIADLLLAISDLYRLAGGSGIKFTLVETREPATA